MNRKKLLPGVLVMFIALALINSADAQSWGPRSLEELKQETLRRASKNLGPITGVITEDAERAMADFDRLDQDRWAEVWVRNGNDYMARAMEISGDEAR